MAKDSTAFDPDAYLNGFDPDAYLGAQPDTTPPQRVPSWAEVPGESANNVASSFANNIINLIAGISPTVKTVSNFLGGGGGAESMLTAQKMGQGFLETMKGRYGSEEAIRNTLATDPVGVAMDVESLVSGGGAIPGLARASKVARVLDPISSSTKLLGKVIPNAVPTKLYGKALRPPTVLSDAQRASLIDTGLKEGIPVSMKGLRKTQDLIKTVTDQVDALVNRAQLSGGTIDILDVMKPVDDMKQFWAKSAYPKEFTATIDKAIDNAIDHYATQYPNGKIPISEAQQIKRNIYQINKNAYEELKGIRIEIAKQMARGIKDEIAKQVPEVAALNARDKRLLAFEDELQKAVSREENKGFIGLGSTIPAGIAYDVFKNVGDAVKMGATARAMAAPYIQSKIALFVNSLKKSNIPAVFGPSVTATRGEQ